MNVEAALFDRRWWALLGGLVVLWVAGAALSLKFGSVFISWHELGHLLVAPEAEEAGAIVWGLRLPRLLLGALAGAGLAVAGAVWQGVLRNPLADPYLIGASAGAAVGGAMALLFGVGAGVSWALPLQAFIGAVAAVALVYRLASQPERPLSVERLLLAGVAVSSFLSAALSAAMVLRSESYTQLYLWLVGSLAGRGWEHLNLAAPYVLVAAVALMVYLPRLNLMQLGQETASSLGLDVRRDPRAVIAWASLLTAAVVAVCGMIGFVGLVVPHIARLLVGPDQRRLVPVAAILGAILLNAADLAARTLWAPMELPVGVLTALLGAPFFLFLLARRQA